jgi:hypothetical protein
MEAASAHITSLCGKIKVKVDGGRIKWCVVHRLPPPLLGPITILVVFNQLCPGKARQRNGILVLASYHGRKVCLLHECNLAELRLGTDQRLKSKPSPTILVHISIPYLWLPTTVAGVMNSSSNTTLPSQALEEPSRRPKRAGQSEEPGKKPKKVNSEIRKQQNRIASRNYRMSTPRGTHSL